MEKDPVFKGNMTSPNAYKDPGYIHPLLKDQALQKLAKLKRYNAEFDAAEMCMQCEGDGTVISLIFSLIEQAGIELPL